MTGTKLWKTLLRRGLAVALGLAVIGSQPAVSLGQTAPGSRFGESVAICATRIAVSAPGAPLGVKQGAGVVVLYDSAWKIIKTLQKPTPFADDAMGQGLAVSDSYVAMGGTGDDTGAPNAGAVILYDNIGQYLRTIKNPDPAADDFFGWRIAISGDYLVIAALGDNITEHTGRDHAGAIYVFSASTGKFLRKIVDPKARAGDWLGSDLSVQGNWVIVGAYGDDTAGPDAGAASVYDLQTGKQIVKLPNPVPAPNARFGYTVRFGPGIVAIGAPNASPGLPQSGAVYIYSTSTWQRIQTLVDTNPTDGGGFGFSLAFTANTLLVGAPVDKSPLNQNGTVTEFDLQSWSRLTPMSSGTGKGGFWGGALASYGDKIVIGAPYELSSGRAYTYTLNSGFRSGPALQLDGKDDYVTVADGGANGEIRPQSGLTIEAFVQFRADTDGAIVTKAFGSGLEKSFALYRQGGMLRGLIGSPSRSVAYAWTPVPGRWHYLAMTYDNSTKSLVLFIDDVPVATNSWSNVSLAYDNSPVTIGADIVSNVPTLLFPGMIDGVRVWNRALSPRSLEINANVVLPKGTPGVLAQWQFNEGVGSQAFDSGSTTTNLHVGLLAGSNGAPGPTWVVSPDLASLPASLTAQAVRSAVMAIGVDSVPGRLISTITGISP